jgi:hydroxypyruvate reductase
MARLMTDTPLDSQTARHLMLDLFQEGLASVNGRHRVRAWLVANPPEGGFHLVALGKAAAAMTAGALDAAGDQLRLGLVVTRHGYLDAPVYMDPRIVALEAGHPLPDERSLAAGKALLQFLQDTPADARFLFLISGGTSSLVEVPVASVSLQMLRQLNSWLLASGLPIGMMNRLRIAVSSIKGGRLLAYLRGRRAVVLFISDVPGDIPEDVGSGLLVPVQSMELPVIPDWLKSFPLDVRVVQASPQVDAQIIASNSMALMAMAKSARMRGIPVHLHPALPAAHAVTCGESLARFLLDAETGVHLWGGETVMQLPPDPGRGGRNQQQALAAARLLEGRNDVLILVAGSDGSDGVSDDAGALVDGATIERGRDAGYDAGYCLARADAGSFLEASGDLIHTGPTGTNVMDLMMGYKG